VVRSKFHARSGIFTPRNDPKYVTRFAFSNSLNSLIGGEWSKVCFVKLSKFDELNFWRKIQKVLLDKRCLSSRKCISSEKYFLSKKVIFVKKTYFATKKYFSTKRRIFQQKSIFQQKKYFSSKKFFRQKMSSV